ncbi:8-oxo-dGTP diphosphatase [Salirhabdus euzebyi]|uniref:8-oxo-dGTP diphosphatase n=1 Tax=Salirhabdus euzebyi TaxID=394506 RepID=A0A841Q8V7_9BACI|nr:8-oxo-dGTP diphosphatase [Salirhabdus euzebyi]MBB6454753.1 8-oxo-dGTP diphosphatase [Salirhabdus euzebyi]
MKKITTTLLTMTIIHNVQKNEVLLINRPEKLGFPGYIGAGGKIELTESFSEGASREIKEETGLSVRPEDLIYKGVDEFTLLNDNYRYIVFNYLATVYSGELLAQPPEGELKWVSMDKLEDVPMQSWFRRRLPYFFQEGTFEISITHEELKTPPLREKIVKLK